MKYITNQIAEPEFLPKGYDFFIREFENPYKPVNRFEFSVFSHADNRVLYGFARTLKGARKLIEKAPLAIKMGQDYMEEKEPEEGCGP